MPEAETSPEFESLLEYVKQSRGFDFTGYKRSSLLRRFEKRIRELGIEDYDSYLEYLEVHPREFVTLFNAILINVTSFFRDAPTWAYLSESVLPTFLENSVPEGRIRVWSAGCASGEEAYTLAIVLAELLGVDEFKRRVKIYGTDIDDDALQTARSATYDESATSGLPPELRSKYFEQVGNHFSFRRDLRRSVIFGRLDVLNDAPISRLSLLSCRNTLMYFNAQTQAQVIERFHFSLADESLLLLGKAETLTAHRELFEVIDRRHRIFRRVSSTRARGVTVEHVPTGAPADRVVSSVQAAALDAVPIPALLIDAAGVLVEANELARQLFNIAPRDYGQLFQDLEISYRPAELRGPLAQAYAERRTVRISNARMPVNGGRALMLDVLVVPLYQSTNAVGAAVFFSDVTLTRDLEEQLRHSTEELEEAYQEMQSTNEELETMNEEQQSTNDELHLVNEQLRLRSDELDELNDFLRAILTSLGGGVVVVDTQRRVLVWNSRAEDLWGLREDEVRGVDITTIDIGLPVVRLASPLKQVLDSADSVPDMTVDAITRRGKSVQCRLSFTPLRSRDRVSGAILVMDVDAAQ